VTAVHRGVWHLVRSTDGARATSKFGAYRSGTLVVTLPKHGDREDRDFVATVRWMGRKAWALIDMSRLAAAPDRPGAAPIRPRTISYSSETGIHRTARGIGLLTVLAVAACSGSPPPKPSPSDSLSQTPTASATPSAGLTWPLTGLPALQGVAARPALAFKVDNVYGALPQAGLNSADLVFEEPVEGGLTRLIAVFQSQNPGTVAPIRSARPVDAQVMRLFGPSILMFSGASRYEIGPVRKLSHALLLSMDSGVPLFARDPNRPGVHDVYASTREAWAWGLSHGASRLPPKSPWTYSAAPSSLAKPATTADMQFGSAQAHWSYHSTSRRWFRAQNGQTDVDTLGVQLWADTVMVLNVPTYYVPGLHDVLGNPTPDARLTGSGRMWLLREGSLVSGTWSRATLDDPFTFKAPDGSVLGVRPGRTWIELLPNGLSPSFR
jgi:hypothetical protein